MLTRTQTFRTGSILVPVVTVVLQLLTLPAFAEVYKVVDENGRVTFTDRLPPQEQTKERVELKKTNVQPALEPRPKKTEESGSNGSGEVRYTSLTIVQPQPEITVPPGQLDVIVQIAIEPQLQPGHRVSLLFDGKPYGEPVAASSFVLGNLYRGTHHVQAQIVNQNNQVVIRSESVPFFVKRASVLNKPTAKPNN